MGSIFKNEKQRKVRNILLVVLVFLGILLAIVGERAREEKVEEQEKQAAAQEKKAETQPENVQPKPNKESLAEAIKDSTDNTTETSGLDNKAQSLKNIYAEDKKAPEAPANQKPSSWMPPENDGPTPSMKKALELQDRNPGRYHSSKVMGSTIIYGIDTTTGQIWLLKDENSKWVNLGKPAKAAPGKNNTFTIISSSDKSATIMDTSTAQTWKVDTAGKWTPISGLPSDKSWK